MYVSGVCRDHPQGMLRAARDTAKINRELECYFAEDEPAVYAKLKRVVKAEGDGVHIELFRGKAVCRCGQSAAGFARLAAPSGGDRFTRWLPIGPSPATASPAAG